MCEEEPSMIPECTLLRQRIEYLEAENRQLHADLDFRAIQLKDARAGVSAQIRRNSKLLDELAECEAKLEQCQRDLVMIWPRLAEESGPPILEAATRIGRALV